jgi:hypothetical protein
MVAILALMTDPTKATPPLPTETNSQPVNLPPVAILQVEPSVLYLGETGAETANLSVALSHDPEGGPLSYAFDGTGQLLGAPSSFGGSPTAAVTYTYSGDYLAAGWVRDGEGAVNRGQALVSVYRFQSITVAGGYDYG